MEVERGREVAEVMGWQPFLERLIGSTHWISLLPPTAMLLPMLAGLSTLASHQWLSSLLLQRKPNKFGGRS